MQLIKEAIGFAKRVFRLGLLNSLGSIICLCLYIAKPFKTIKLCPLHSDRLGHLAGLTDVFLRRLQLDTQKRKTLYVGISGEPANQQLLRMFQRKFFVIKNALLHKVVNGSLLVKTEFYNKLTSHNYAYYEFNNTEPNLHFTTSEEEQGKELLNKVGIDERSWFACFHSRDAVYLSTQWKRLYHSSRDWGYHHHRDCDIKNYLEAAKYIASSGGFAVRVGYGVAKKLPDLNNPRIIDYASYHRTDFGDIYLLAKCKFLLGNNDGLWSTCTIFHVPVACANFIPFELTPLRKGDLFIPKKLWSVKEKRFLTLREILESGVGRYASDKQYAEAGLEAVENTAEEILDLAKEMNERLDGNFAYTEEDEELQKRFHSLYQPHHRCYGTPARIGARFLRQNEELLA